MSGLKENFPSGVTIRQMKEDDVRGMVETGYRTESWNIPYEDVLAQYRASPEGCFTAELDGENVGFCMCSLWGETLAFGGYSYVVEGLRGKGIGSALWKRRFAFVGDRNFGVNAVEARKEANKRIGITLIDEAWKLAPYFGAVNPADIKMAETAPGQDVVPYEENMFKSLVDYDREVNTMCLREKYIRGILDVPSATCFVAMDKGRVVGYGIIMSNIRGHRISPLYCDSPNLTRLLLKKLLLSVPEEKPELFWCGPDSNPLVTEIAAQFNLSPAWLPMHRMFTKRALKGINCDRIFGTCGCETVFI